MLHVFTQVRCQSLFPVALDALEEAMHVLTLVSAENHALQRAVAARIAEDVGVAMPVPARDAVAAEQIENWIRVKLPAHEDPHADAVTAHGGPEVKLHLLLLDLPFPESAFQSRACLLAGGEGCHDGRTSFRGRGGPRFEERHGCRQSHSDPETSAFGRSRREEASCVHRTVLSKTVL